ncbi:PREDICTED: DNA damage-regulated autophagy modulator protein 1-like [Amphimedon queenslandica]|uniref:CWH43-like N-terminal domain-containing protein n=1 Tax=Amphimedon queenslandica TaxID=400682 RepID=A0A1X7UN45_AMPQE|nr:PREDICTED: DNA damage-regulated autophagy modulator protein 1-like [Amphimedon queenslandica]|eukprot:XP_019853160.1 PREDICTED: DNA damage-regulated autophagy modulator protein 1-like [Amphimedon queenslandica]
MTKLGQVNALQILHFAVFEIFLTILVCYVLAVAFGHVPIWLPMISDCAVKSPEKYFFRIGVVFGASLIGIQSFIVYYANKDKQYSFFELLLALIGSVSVGIVGVVNEEENPPIHLTFALIFFLCYDLYMVLSLLAYCIKKPSILFSLKTVCTIVGAIVGIRLIIVYAKSEAVEPVCEWINAFAIMGFIWSYMLMDDIEIIEVKVEGKRKTQ